MGAEVNTGEKSFFVLEKPELRIGAIATGSPNYVDGVLVLPETPTSKRRAVKFNWLVCPHLSEPELVYDYYMASGLITIVLGKCFCDTCLDLVYMKGDLAEFVSLSKPMTDTLFQENFINPLLDSNYNFSKILGYIEANDYAPKTWISCPHLKTTDKLKDVYSKGKQIFIFESFFTCQDCFNKIPTNSLVDIIYEGESMTDRLFQQKIIDSLFPINHDSLAAIGQLEHHADTL